MPEWRKNPIVGRWVVIAPERGKRSSDFRVEPQVRKQEHCPLCPGHEADTPPEVLASADRERAPDTPGWRVRVVPNKFPAVCEMPFTTSKQGIYEWMSGSGRHEIVIETPEHVAGLQGQSPEQVAEVLRIWSKRYRQLKLDPRWRYVQVFKNVGLTAGASLEHSHSQIFAIPFIPEEICRELEGMAVYYRNTGRCIFCDMIAQELKDGRRLVHEEKGFISFAPFASRFPGEVWIAPREHVPDFAAMETPRQLRELAETLLVVFQGLGRVFGDPPYNLVLHTAPTGVPNAAHFHWHFEILPRLTVTAGFELGTGCYINPLIPEETAARLRDAKQTRRNL